MKNQLLANKPYKFVRMTNVSKQAWGLEAPPTVSSEMLTIARHPISEREFTIDELKQIMRVAIDQGECLEAQQAIITAITERTRLIIDGWIKFKWLSEGGVSIQTYAENDEGLSATAITIDSHSLKELDDLLEVVARQKESPLISQFIRRIQARIVDRRIAQGH